MYSSEDIKTVHLEITSRCNAHCPMCGRNVCGGRDNPQLPQTELSLQDVQNILPSKFVKQIKRLYMCGNYGDPMVAQDTLEVFEYLRAENPDIHLKMFTNGSGRSRDWWQKLAQVVNEVHFGIDGLEETNATYRRGTRWHKIMEACESYIQAGGSATWDYIVFRHNEHQVADAHALSQKLGFKKFNVKRTGRFFSNAKNQVKNHQAVLDKTGRLQYVLETPKNPKYQNTALSSESLLVEKFGSMDTYLDKCQINCKVQNEKSIYISAEGLVMPCCWLANQLYVWYLPTKKSQTWELINSFGDGLQSINAKNHPIAQIISSDFFQEKIPKSWSQSSVQAGKLKVCAKTCGTEFDPFKKQFSMSGITKTEVVTV